MKAITRREFSTTLLVVTGYALLAPGVGVADDGDDSGGDSGDDGDSGGSDSGLDGNESSGGGSNSGDSGTAGGPETADPINEATGDRNYSTGDIEGSTSDPTIDLSNTGWGSLSEGSESNSCLANSSDGIAGNVNDATSSGTTDTDKNGSSWFSTEGSAEVGYGGSLGVVGGQITIDPDTGEATGNVSIGEGAGVYGSYGGAGTWGVGGFVGVPGAAEVFAEVGETGGNPSICAGAQGEITPEGMVGQVSGCIEVHTDSVRESIGNAYQDLERSIYNLYGVPMSW